jgi:N utilization substance protein B
MSARQKRISREVVLWILYASDIKKTPPREVYEVSLDLLEELAEDWSGEISRLCRERLEALEPTPTVYDEAIQPLSPDWRLERMAVVDRNILRLGVSELDKGETLPLIVVNACVELAKEYGGEGTHGFVNGVLDSYCKEHGIELKRA